MLVQFDLLFNLVCHHLMSFLLSIVRYRHFSCALSTISLIYFLNYIRFNFLSNFVSIFFLTFFPYKAFFFIITLYPYFLKLSFLQFSSNSSHLLILFVIITLCHYFHRLLDITILADPSQPSIYFCFLNNIRFDYLSCSFSFLTLIFFLLHS